LNACADDVSLMLYTSGTTGRPKGVPRRHRAKRAAALAHVAQNLYRPGERTLGVMPLYHTMGVRSLIAMSLIGGTFVCLARYDADRALAAYGLNGASEPQADPENGNVLTQWTTDSAFRCGTVQELVWHTSAGNAGYEYQFSRTVHGQEARGAAHASEIPFVFGTLPVWQKRNHYDDSDENYAAVMQQYWTNFAKTGDPNGADLVKWPKFDPSARAYLDFTDAGPVVKEGLRRQVCDVYIENEKRLSSQ